MDRSQLIPFVVLLALSACSDQAVDPDASAAVHPSSPPVAEDPNAVRAKLTASGIPSEYAARFEGNQLVRITEHRQLLGGASQSGEYTFTGARLIGYRGANIGDSTPLDLQFDMQGALQSGQGASVDEEDLSAIRGRAQLLRSHALAQRATRTH